MQKARVVFLKVQKMIKEEKERFNGNTSAQGAQNADLYRQPKYIAAIDIGTTKIVAAIGTVSGKGKVEILGMADIPSKGVKRGMVLNIEETAASIKEAVQLAERESKLNFDEVYVGIAGQHIRSFKNSTFKNIQSTDGEITQEDVDELTKDMYNSSIENGEEIIHVIPQLYIVDKDKYVKQPVGMFGKRLEGNFHIVVGEQIAAKYIKKSIERAGLKVKGLILEPLASSSAVITEDEKEVGIAMVDIGGGTTDIAIFHDGIVRHTAVVPFGGDVITKDIKNACSILERDAEKLKIENGMAIGEAAPENEIVSVPGISGREPKTFHVRFLSSIIQARMEEIIDFITYELENSGYFDKLGAGIKVTGGGALLKYLKQLLSYKTSLDVHVAFPDMCLNNEDSKANSPAFSTSIGLLLRGYRLNQEEQKIAERIKQVEDLKSNNTQEDEEDTEGYDDDDSNSFNSWVGRLFKKIEDRSPRM